MADLSPTPRKPLVEPRADEQILMTPERWAELQRVIDTESQVFRRTGRLASPKRIGSRASLIEATAVKEVSPSDNKCDAPTTSKFFLPRLCDLFEIFGALDVQPQEHFGLHALHLVATEKDPRVLWTMQTELERRINARLKLHDEAYEKRSQHAKELMASQNLVTPQKAFTVSYNNALNDMKYDADHDKTMLDRMDRNNKLQEEREAAAKSKDAELLQQKLEQKKAERLKRNEERQRQLEQLRQQEEDEMDHLQAVERVKKRWDVAKENATRSGDVSKLDEY